MSTFTVVTYTAMNKTNSVLHHSSTAKAQALYANRGMAKFIDALQEINVPASNLLMIALSWAGGTIHQVQTETGLTVQQILDLEKVKPDLSGEEVTPYMFGLMYGASAEHMKQYKGNVQFWHGVLENTIQYKKHKINYNEYI